MRSSALLAARDTSFADYSGRVADSINVLNAKFYNADTGIWDNAWWNSGNAFTMLADYATYDADRANAVNVGGYLWNTYNNAQRTDRKVRKDYVPLAMSASPKEHKRGGAGGDDDSSLELLIVQTEHNITRRHDDDTPDLAARGFAGFINEFYDDMGWWALGLLRAWDVTRTQEYLDSAMSVFADMRTGTNTNCGGGIYWNKERKYVNAISNELYLSVAAGLANRVSDESKRRGYLNIAKKQWLWFRDSGMVDRGDNLINDGLNGDCKNNGQAKWTYNQGVILGGLVELYRATDLAAYLDRADEFALAAIKGKTVDGVLHEHCEPDCGADGDQFKGVFARNLGYLHRARPRDEYKTFLVKNAESIWANDRSDDGRHGTQWAGPASAGKLNGPSHSSALDALVAVLAASS
jgi:predicted alpha-1,6-mannanase (GH76 family)